MLPTFRARDVAKSVGSQPVIVVCLQRWFDIALLANDRPTNSTRAVVAKKVQAASGRRQRAARAEIGQEKKMTHKCWRQSLRRLSFSSGIASVMAPAGGSVLAGPDE